jgi:sec-independent protein translocase protein TatB
VFENLNIWEVGVLLLLALFIFGPERLPKVINDGVRMLRQLRNMARNATNDLSRELGTDVRLEDLHPKTFIRKHLLSEEEEQQLRRPFDDAYRDLRQLTADVNDVTSRPQPPSPLSPSAPPSPLAPRSPLSPPAASPPAASPPAALSPSSPLAPPSALSPSSPSASRSQGPLRPYDTQSRPDPPVETRPRDGAVVPHQDRPYGGGAARTHGETMPPRDPGAQSYDADAT